MGALAFMFTSFSHAKILYLCAIPTEVKVRRDPSSFNGRQVIWAVTQITPVSGLTENTPQIVFHTYKPQSYSYFCPLVIELKEIQGTTAPFLTLLSLSRFVY